MIAPAPVSAPTPAFAPASTGAKKTFASIVKPSDNDVVEASKDDKMNNTNEPLRKVNIRNCRVTYKGTLVVKVSSENDGESAVA